MSRNNEQESSLSLKLNSTQFQKLRSLRPVCLYSVDSTQDYLKKKEGSQEGDFVTSSIQTAGRGREGRKWFSDEGGLYISLKLSPPISLLERIVLIASGSILQTFERDYGLSCTIKRPNDVLCNGKKIAGVLVDSEVKPGSAEAYVGMGVDLNNGDKWDEEMRSIATSYFLETKSKVNLEEYIVKLLLRFDASYCNLFL